MNLTEIDSFNPKALAITGFKAANQILVSWGCTAHQCQDILKLSKYSYRKFKSHPETTQLTDDQLERVSHLLKIHQALRCTFSNPANISRFMTMPNHNDFFSGRKPLEIIMSGNFSDLYEVARRIGALRDELGATDQQES